MTCLKFIVIGLIAYAHMAYASNDELANRRYLVKAAPERVASRPSSGLIQTGLGLELNLSRSNTDDTALILILGSHSGKKIQGIDASYTSISIMSLSIMARISSLTKLTLKAVNIFIHELAILGQIRALTQLDLSECSKLRGDLSGALRNTLGHLPIRVLRLEKLEEGCILRMVDFISTSRIFTQLNTLRISYSHVNDVYDATLPIENFYIRGVNIFSHTKNIVVQSRNIKMVKETNPKLKDFNLAHEKHYAEFRESVPRKFPQENQHLSEVYYNLEIIEDYLQKDSQAKAQQYANQTFLKVANLPSLHHMLTLLDLSENRLIDANLAPLARMQNLKALLLENNPLTQECLTHLKGLALTELSLKKTFVADYKVEAGKRMPLQLTFPGSLKRLLLDGSLIEGHTLNSIYKLSDIHTLSLISLKLDDAGVKSVFTCPRFIQIRIDKSLLEREEQLCGGGGKWTSAAKFTFK